MRRCVRDLKGKTVLISGGTSGIGAGILEACKLAGMITMSVSRKPFQSEGGAVVGDAPTTRYFKGNVTRYSDMEKISQCLIEDSTSLDVLVCNAGIGAFDGDLLSEECSTLQQVIDVNLNGVLNCLRAFDGNLSRAFCDVVVIGSVAGRRSYAGSIYSVSKSAVDSLVENYRGLVKGRPIRVTQVLPGTVRGTGLFGRHVESGLGPSDLGNSVVFCLEQLPEIQISELTISGTKF